MELECFSSDHLWSDHTSPIYMHIDKYITGANKEGHNFMCNIHQMYKMAKTIQYLLQTVFHKVSKS